ncbi:Gldg family protein [Treponema sp.]
MHKRQTILISLLICSIFLLLFLNSGRYWLRLDLSRGKFYSLSKASQELYKEINQELKITYYRSEKLAKMHPTPLEIEDLLKEYVSYSRGTIRLHVQDPVKAGTEAAVQRLGIPAQQIQTVEKDQSSLARVYTGIVLEYLNKTETIPVAFSLESLEYDISSRIRSLLSGSKRELGVLVASGDKTWTADFSFLENAFASAGYNVRPLAINDEIPASLSALFVFGGELELEEAALYRINAFLRSGGPILFAVDGVSIDSRGDLQAMPISSSKLLDMLAEFGVRVEPELALDTAALSLPFQTTSPTGGTQVRLVRYPHWVALLDKNANKNHPLTSQFGGLDLYWPSPLRLLPVRGIQEDILASTTKDAWRMTKDFVTNPEYATSFDAERSATGGPIPLLVSLQGIFPDTFGATDTLPPMPKEGITSRVIVVGDGDFATTLIQYTKSQRNIDFLLSAAEWLASDDDLLLIRPRSGRDGRLDAISDSLERQRIALRARILNIALVPLLLIGYGLLRSYRRRKSSFYKKEPADVL